MTLCCIECFPDRRVQFLCETSETRGVRDNGDTEDGDDDNDDEKGDDEEDVDED